MLWDGLDRTGRADRHEDRRLDDGVGQRHRGATSRPADLEDLEVERHSGDFTWAGLARPAAAVRGLPETLSSLLSQQ